MQGGKKNFRLRRAFVHIRLCPGMAILRVGNPKSRVLSTPTLRCVKGHLCGGLFLCVTLFMNNRPYEILKVRYEGRKNIKFAYV